ncbi:hypothetical protein XcvCFBP7112P_18855 [Xanthomonas citri pv. vignicola]|nr:hypothetical protein XcvCFBP7112P_18855 [Xanthomonas citri pv. vignicola]
MWLLWLVRGWVAAVRRVGGDALMSSRCTPANKRADASRTTTSKTPSCGSLFRGAELRALHLTFQNAPFPSLRSPGGTAWSLR